MNLICSKSFRFYVSPPSCPKLLCLVIWQQFLMICPLLHWSLIIFELLKIPLWWEKPRMMMSMPHNKFCHTDRYRPVHVQYAISYYIETWYTLSRAILHTSTIIGWDLFGVWYQDGEPCHIHIFLVPYGIVAALGSFGSWKYQTLWDTFTSAMCFLSLIQGSKYYMICLACLELVSYK